MAADVRTTGGPGQLRRWGWVAAAVAAAAASGAVAVELRKAVGRSPQPAAVAPPDVPAGRPLHSVEVRKPAGPPVVKTGVTDRQGNPVTIACNTCHASKPPNPDARLGKDLEFFHQGLTGHHGNLTCGSCHNPADGYASLRLADGRSVPYPEVMQLCAQCHGPQYRDYQHGAHGGMAGHWDLTTGGRTRNNCVDCHDPHAPKYPKLQPAQGPRDRGVTPNHQTTSGGHAHE
jgi:hypothetical protein